MESDSPENNYHVTSSRRAPSPDLFSSEDEETYKTDDFPNQSVPPSPRAETTQPEGKNLVLELESARLQRLMALLQGVPPPPSVTIPQISLNEVLKKLRENADELCGARASDMKEPVSSLWKPNALFKDVLNMDWPEIKNVIYHDMHFNTCTASEDVEHISLKLHERFIGAETSSWCNAVTSSLPSNSRQRQRRSLGNTSPGCRLSHLARRRQTFSSANLAQLSSVAGSGTAGGAPVPGSSLSAPRRRLINGGGTGLERRCIMVEIKKNDKNKRIKTSNKDTMNKFPQSGNATKTVAQVQVQDPVQSTKRALFQSPEEEKRAAAAAAAVLPSQHLASESSNAQRSKRALWPSERETSLNDNGKRTLERSDSSSSQRSKMHCSEDRAPYSRATRSLPFPLGQNSGASAQSSASNSSHSNNSLVSATNNKFTRRVSDQGLPSQECNLNVELSELHKRKLYWAITSALRSYGINNRNHSDFIRLTSDLAFYYIKVRSSMTGPPPASTSEHMLQVVTTKAAEVIQAVRAEKSGQEENLGGSKVQKKEERSNKELFRDATASLNVRRSLCASLSTTNHQSSNDKPKQTKRVPSARKSLSFETLDPRASSGTISDEPAEKAEIKFQLDTKGNDCKWKGNGENVPLASAKRVSRSLFLSPKDDVKVAKKDACEQTCAPDNEQPCSSDNHSSSNKICDEAMDVGENKSEDVKKVNTVETSDADERHHQTSSEMSSIPSVSAESSTLEADNEASRTSEATNLSEQPNSLDASINLAVTSKNLTKENGSLEKLNVHNVSDKTDFGSSESGEYVPMRVLRDTRERAARQAVQPARRASRKSLSLTRRQLRSSSSDSTDQDHALTCHLPEKSILINKATENLLYNCAAGTSLNLDPLVVLSPLKAVSAESNTASKSTFGSPPFITDSTLTPVHSPFLGFPSKDDLNSSAGAADGSDSIAKVDGGTSEEGNFSQPGCIKADIEEKVITPLLEAAVLESSVCVGSGSSQSTDADLSFRGRIESLKPSNVSETAISLDLGMNLNVSANILNMDESKEKSPVLEKWAERASRSAQKSCIAPESDSDNVMQDAPAAGMQKPTDHTAEESMLHWEESHLGEVSQCSTNMYEKFCSIFGPSSHQGNP